MSKTKIKEETNSFENSVLFESIKEVLVLFAIIGVLIAGFWLAATKLIDTANGTYIPVKYYEEASILEIHPLNGGNTFQRVDTDSGFIYIISHSSGGFVFYKRIIISKI